MREKVPDRRASWTQTVRIEGQRFYASFGEFRDGRLAEVWIEAQKEGTFTRGTLGSLARTVSIALQCGTPPEEVVKSLRQLDYPPRGPVEGSPAVRHCTSLADWLAQEIDVYYVRREPPEMPPAPAEPATEAVPGKVLDLRQKSNPN